MALPKNIEDRFYELQDTNYREFNGKIARPVLPHIGVRTPMIRGIAKAAANDASFDIRAYFSEFCPSTYEEQIFAAFLLSAEKRFSFAEKLDILRKMIPTFDNWAVVDQFTASFHEAKKHRDELLAFLLPYQNGGEFEQRLVAVMLMTYYADAVYSDVILRVLPALDNDGYYTKMGVAWAVSVIAVKLPSVADQLLDGRLDVWIHNKAIQKITESYRFSEQEKAKYKALKRR